MPMLKTIVERPLFIASALMMAAGIGVFIAAMLFEHIGGYRPCELCLLERKPWYFAAPAGFMALFAVRLGRLNFAQGLLAAIALLFLLNAGLAGYHAGIEWKWWLGPASCTGDSVQPLGGGPGGLLEALKHVQIVPCDEAQFRLFGLSFAGYNFFMSLASAIVAFYGLWLGWQNRLKGEQ